ncbi:uncharacterized protein LOC120351332 [Nilaparvata lugens]|nr:uncharacterized protein LOC120351332 [Nilaparvata lugens]
MDQEYGIFKSRTRRIFDNARKVADEFSILQKEDQSLLHDENVCYQALDSSSSGILNVIPSPSMDEPSQDESVNNKNPLPGTLSSSNTSNFILKDCPSTFLDTCERYKNQQVSFNTVSTEQSMTVSPNDSIYYLCIGNNSELTELVPLTLEAPSTSNLNSSYVTEMESSFKVSIEHPYCLSNDKNCNDIDVSDHSNKARPKENDMHFETIETAISINEENNANDRDVSEILCHVTNTMDTSARSSSNSEGDKDLQKSNCNVDTVTPMDPGITNSMDENHSSSGRPKRGRKLKYENQNRTMRKKLCIQNKDYYTQRNKFKEAKAFRHYICKCKCLERIGEENARKEYDKFYNVESHDAQRALICSMISELKIKRKRVKNSDTRKFTRVYNMLGKVVCKTFFLQTL